MKTNVIAKVAAVAAAVLLTPGLCLAQSEVLKERVPTHENMHLKMNPSVARMLASTVSGEVKLAKSSNGRPTAANACADITVSASEKSSIIVPTGKAGESLKLDDMKPVRAVRTSGNFEKDGYCRYLLVGLPLNRKLYIGAHYAGGWSLPLGGGPIVSRPAGWNNPVVLTNAKKSRAGANLELFAVPLR